MKMLFKKRRYYKGEFRNPGTVMEVEPLFARAFQRVGAAIPAITVAAMPSPEKDPAPLKITRTRTPAMENLTSEEEGMFSDSDFEEGE